MARDMGNQKECSLDESEFANPNGTPVTFQGLSMKV